MSGPAAHQRLLLRPAPGYGVGSDGLQLFEVVQTDTLVWSASTYYPIGAPALGSDGHVYVSKVPNNRGNNPVGDGGAHWQPSW